MKLEVLPIEQVLTGRGRTCFSAVSKLCQNPIC